MVACQMDMSLNLSFFYRGGMRGTVNLRRVRHQQAVILRQWRRICALVESPGSGRSFVSVRKLSVPMARAGSLSVHHSADNSESGMNENQDF